MPILINDNKLAALEKAVKYLRKCQHEHQLGVEREGRAGLDMSPARKQRLRDAVIDSSRIVDIAQHEVHVLCVEAGLASPEPWRYGEKSYQEELQKRPGYYAGEDPNPQTIPRRAPPR